MIQSPLNYTGGKYKLLPQILPLFPETMDTFVDLFCGGCNVGINVDAARYIYNDKCRQLIGLYGVMQRTEAGDFIKRVKQVVEKYGLSDVSTYGYERYGCESTDGLSSYNRERYLRLRADVNAAITDDDDYYINLYVLIVYAFNNQIRFNRNGEFNLPPGKRDFNRKMQEKLELFINRLHDQNESFLNLDFTDVNLEMLTEADFVYADPPYLITCASYNEQGGWSNHDEYDLLNLLDRLNSRKVNFALSNVLESKGKINTILKQWLEDRPEYRVIDLDFSYDNANYHRQGGDRKTKEILVVNY